MPLSEIGKLTRLQAEYVYAHPRDDDGNLLPYGPPESVREALGPPPSYRRVFWDHYRERGFPAWQIEALWAGRQAKQGRNGRG